MRLNSIPATFDNVDIPVKNWRDVSDLDRESRMVANAIVDFDGRPDLPLEVFHHGKTRAAWRKLRTCSNSDLIPLDMREEFEHLADPTAVEADKANLVGRFIARNGLKAGANLVDSLAEGSETAEQVVSRMLAAEVRPENPPPPDDPVFHVAGRLTGTTGNIGALIARAKTGKTAVIGAHVSACLVADGLGNAEADTLGVRSEPPKGKADVEIDTEQSPGDACKLVERALRRVGLTAADRPAWLRAFSFAGWKAHDLVVGLPGLIESLATEHGGVHAVFIDGGADFAVNVNDPETAADLCAGWHDLTIQNRFHMVIVIHSNEGEKADDIARGWLGKQLRRKAESNLQLKRNGETITVFAESGQRRAPIPEKEGPCFAWSDESGMHLTTPNNPKVTRKQQELETLAQECFADVNRMRYKDLHEKIVTLRGWARSTADAKISAMEALGVIRTGAMGLKERVLR